MKVLVTGGGGREHALVWKILRDEPGADVFCAPGNGGISDAAGIVPVKATDIGALLSFVKKNNIDLTIAGSEDSLAAGITDAFAAEGLRVYGPTANAARLESSKRFSKGFMEKYGIPTARHASFSDFTRASEYARSRRYPLYVKADGLAAGKGAFMCVDAAHAVEILEDLMIGGSLGASGGEVVIEEFMEGREVTVLAFCDGTAVTPMCAARDYKRVCDGDEGPNTGGMGAVSPVEYYTPDMAGKCMESVFLPTLRGLGKEGIKYTGVIYFGLMITDLGPKVVEYNCRFGDPEAQVVLRRMNGNLPRLAMECADGGTVGETGDYSGEACVCVVASSEGYPGKYETGRKIEFAKVMGENDIVFHAGTVKRDGSYYTNGGRVLGVTSMGANAEEAAAKAYKAIEGVGFEGMHYRKDIGKL